MITAFQNVADTLRAIQNDADALKANREFAECMVGYEEEVSPELTALLFDPQTAGGLLISVSEKQAESLVQGLRDLGLPAAVIGAVLPGEKPLIRIS